MHDGGMFLSLPSRIFSQSFVFAKETVVVVRLPQATYSVYLETSCANTRLSLVRNGHSWSHDICSRRIQSKLISNLCHSSVYFLKYLPYTSFPVSSTYGYPSSLKKPSNSSLSPSGA